MSLNHIITEPFEISDITVCDIDMMVNEHFKAVVTGHMQLWDREEVCLRDMLRQTFVVKALSHDGGEETLFRGTISDIILDNEGGLLRVTVTAESKTAMLDQENHIRTFQGDEQTYRQIVDAVLSFRNDVSTIHPKGKGIRAEGFVIQYEETDWQFLKRLASRINTVLVADCTNDRICFFFGNPERKGEEAFHKKECRMRRYSGYGGVEASEYIIQSGKVLKLCEQVFIEGAPCYVYRISSSYKRKELEFEYTFRPAKGFQVPPISNHRVVGVSVMGKVSAVRDTEVRVCLSGESDFDFDKPIWFPFSTIYSSPDGTGWYCMPEKGDQVRLYIPDIREHHAYAISAVHLGNESGLRENVEEKSIRTIHGKEIRFTPKGIRITNNQGMSIVLDDEEGILIKSNGKIELVSEEGIELKGRQVSVEGKKGVLLMEGPNMLMVRDGIKEQGMNIEHC